MKLLCKIKHKWDYTPDHRIWNLRRECKRCPKKQIIKGIPDMYHKTKWKDVWN